MEEYNPDTQVGGGSQAPNTSGKKVIKVPLNDPRPFSPENPCYKEKYEKHVAMGVPMFMCPACHFMGRHKATELDQPKTTPYRVGGELCDICGDEDTYEYA